MAKLAAFALILAAAVVTAYIFGMSREQPVTVPAAPVTSVAARPAPAPQPRLSFNCQVTETGGEYTSSSFTVTATNDGDQTINSYMISVVFYGESGQELASNPDVSFPESVPPGQSVTAQLASETAPGVTACQVSSWS